MCLANIYMEKNHELLMSNTASIEVKGDTVVLRDLFGVTKEILGTIRYIDLENSTVTVSGMEKGAKAR